MAAKKYNIQCVSHGCFCGTVSEGHPLYEECVRREAEGLLDALMVYNDPENCSQCAEEQQKLDRSNLSYWEMRRDPKSDWYEEEPLTEEEQENLKATLKRLGIREVCWNCKHYGRSLCRYEEEQPEGCPNRLS